MPCVENSDFDSVDGSDICKFQSGIILMPKESDHKVFFSSRSHATAANAVRPRTPRIPFSHALKDIGSGHCGHSGVYASAGYAYEQRRYWFLQHVS